MSKQLELPMEEVTQPAVLCFCVGGSGVSAATALKKSLATSLASGLSLIRAIDGDPAGKKVLGKQQFYHYEECPIHNLIDQIRQDPDSFPGLKQLGDVDALKRAAGTSQLLTNGYQGSRPLAKAGLDWELFKNPTKFLNYIKEAIEDLRPAAETIRQKQARVRSGAALPQTTPASSLEIPLFGSCAGACASGQLNDLGWLMDYTARYKAEVSKFEVSLHLFLPSCFNHNDERHLNANAYAFLLELMAAMEQTDFPPLRLGSLELRRNRPPFQHITLWSGNTASDLSHSGIEPVAEIMAESTRMKMEGEIGAMYRSLSANPLRHVTFPYIAQAAGCFRLTLEKDAMKQAGGYRLGGRLATEHLLRQLPDDKAQALGEQQAQEFIHQVGLGNLAQVYARDPQGRPYTVSVDAFSKSPRKSLPGILADYEEKALAIAKRSMGQLTEAEMKRIHQALVERVEILLNASEGGLLQAPALLTALNYQLSQQQKRIQQQLNRAEKELETWHQEQKERNRNRLKRITANMRKALLARAKEKIELRLRILKLLAQQELQTAIQQFIEQLLQSLTRWVSAVEHLSQQLTSRHDQFSLDREMERPVCVLNVLNAAEEDRILAEHVEAAWVEATQGLSFAWEDGKFVLFHKDTNTEVFGAQSLWEEAGIEAFANYAGSFFVGLEDLSIESLIGELALTPIMGNHKTNKEERILQWMTDRAAPLIKLDDVKQKEDVIAITLFASENGASGYFQAAAGRSSWTCVTSHDPFNVELLISWHHINPWALQSMPVMQEAYDALKDKETLHVFEEWHDWPKVETSEFQALEHPLRGDNTDHSKRDQISIFSGEK